MSALEEKEKHLNKLRAKVDNLLKNDHPASDKIEVWDTMSLYALPAMHACEYKLWFLFIFCACAFFTGLQGHLADSVELAPSNYKMHRHSSEGEFSLQPGKCSSKWSTLTEMITWNMHMSANKRLTMTPSAGFFTLFYFEAMFCFLSFSFSFIRRPMRHTALCRRNERWFVRISPVTRTRLWRTCRSSSGTWRYNSFMQLLA